FDLGAKKGDVQAVAASAKAIRDTLGKADETVRVANQIDAVIGAERDSGASLLGGLVGGGLLGGAPGALLGAAFGVVTKPGQMIRQMAAIEAMAKNVDGRIARGLKGFFGKHGSKASRKALPMP